MKCKMKIKRIMFPKKKVESGDYAIFVAELLELKEGSERPIENKEYGTVSLKGIVPAIKQGDIFDFTLGKAIEDKYGVSYEVLGVGIDFIPENKKELNSFLEVVCGKSIAKELMKLENPYELLQSKNDEELLKVKGIGRLKLLSIYKNLGNYGDKSLAYAKLEPLGISRKLISDMCMYLGGSAGAIDMCFNNPYGIIDKMKGVGFLKADDIAQKCGYHNTELRVKNCIVHILETNAESGKSYLTAVQIVEEVKKFIDIDFNIIDSSVKSLIKEGRVALSECGNMIALTEYIKLEHSIAERIIQLSKANSLIKVPRKWREMVKEIEDKQGWKHTEEQMIGIETVLNNNVVVVRGLAGTGKSTVTNAMSEILSDYQIEMCCLSAKASQRLREVTKRNAQTIHKMLGLGMAGNNDKKSEVFADIVILDEASMVNGTIFLKLIQAMKLGAKLIILGDTGQLTSIGNCSIFNDLINSGKIPVVELTKIHRQAQKSAIVTESRRIREQKSIYEKGFRGHKILGELQDLELFVQDDSEVLMEIIKNKFKEDLDITKYVLEVQIITPVKTRGKISVNSINLEIQKMYNSMSGKNIEGQDGVKIFEGDKIINLKNNYSSLGVDESKKPVWNGSIGKVVEIREGNCIVDFVGIGEVIIDSADYKNINLGYAISCHSSQGSQWERVICAIDMGAYMLLNVEILYTALTRARKHCSLIVEHKAMSLALRKVEQKTKQTLLPIFLK